MKATLMFSYFTLLLLFCEKDPALWEGTELTMTREKPH